MTRNLPRGLSVVVAVFAGVLSPAHGMAQSSVRADIDTTLVTVGDRITMTVTVDHPAGSRVSWPDSLELGPFEVLEATVQPAQTAADRATTRGRLVLAAFELGELEIPGFEVTVTSADGSTEVLGTDRFGVEVVTVGADEGGDIREIRGPLAIPVSVVRIGLGLVVLLMFAAGALYAWRQRRGRRSLPGRPPAPPEPARPAHEVALEALDALQGSSMLERGQVKDYHIRLAFILRQYVEGAL